MNLALAVRIGVGDPVGREGECLYDEVLVSGERPRGKTRQGRNHHFE
ncbi:hypothetical protein [Streptomyces sp. NPDC015345]